MGMDPLREYSDGGCSGGLLWPSGTAVRGGGGTMQGQNGSKLAAEIALDRNLPAEAVQREHEVLLPHLKWRQDCRFAVRDDLTG